MSKVSRIIRRAADSSSSVMAARFQVIERVPAKMCKVIRSSVGSDLSISYRTSSALITLTHAARVGSYLPGTQDRLPLSLTMPPPPLPSRQGC